MNNNNITNKIIFHNYLEDSWKEEKNVAWRLVKKNNIFFNSLRKNGLLFNKSSNLNYKQQFLVSILSQYLYSIKQHLKLYSLFLLFFKTLKKNSFYKMNSLYRKKRKIGYFRKFTIKKYKKYYLIWYKKWFRKKYKKYRKILWKQFHRVPENFWSKLLKKRSKIFIFNILKSNFFKKKLFLKNYNQIVKIFFFFIRRRKGKRISRKKFNKKYRINITIPIFLQKIKYLQKKTYKQSIFPHFKKNNNYIKNYNNNFPINIFYNKMKYLFFFYKKLYYFFINYNYYFYFLNLKNKNIFNQKKDILINYYKALSLIYNNKKIKKYSFIRTCILKKKLEYSNIKHGNNTNIVFFWQDRFLKNFLTSYKYILYNLLSYINNNVLVIKNKYICNTTLYSKIINNIFFIIKKNTNYNKKNIKLFFLLYLNKCNKKNNIKINIFNNWYKNIIKKTRKRKKYKRYYNSNRKMFFYPFRVKLKKRFIKKYIKKNNFNKLFYLNKQNVKFKKRLIMYKRLIQCKNSFINNKEKYYTYNNKNLLLKKKRHFLKKYKRKIKRKIYFRKYKKNSLTKISNKKVILKYDKNKFFFSRNNKRNNKLNKKYIRLKKKYIFFKKKYILLKKIKKLISYKKISQLYINIKNENLIKLLKKNTLFVKKKKKNISLLNTSLIYREFLLKIKFKFKNKQFNKYRRILKFIKYKINLKTNNIYNNLDKYDKFNVNINSKNINLFIYNISMLCPYYKYAYSNLLIDYKKWISVEVSKNLFFKWVDAINNLNNINLCYKNYLIKY